MIHADGRLWPHRRGSGRSESRLGGAQSRGHLDRVATSPINAMLLNEFLKEHRKVQDLEATVAQQHKGMEVLAAQLKEQAAQIQKVSAQLELNKPAPRTVPTISKKIVAAVAARARGSQSRGYRVAISRHASPRGGFLFCSFGWRSWIEEGRRRATTMAQSRPSNAAATTSER